MGADDYMTKPFSPQKLMARLRVALRHGNLPPNAGQVVFDGVVVDFGKVEGDPKRHNRRVDGTRVQNSAVFIQNSDRVITRAELLKHVGGGGNGYTTTRSIDNHIMKLRHKLEKRSKLSDPLPKGAWYWV